MNDDYAIMKNNLANTRGSEKPPLALRVSVEHYLWLADHVTLLIEANELLRSTHEIAARGGADTNWPPFASRVLAELKAQHDLMHSRRAST